MHPKIWATALVMLVGTLIVFSWPLVPSPVTRTSFFAPLGTPIIVLDSAPVPYLAPPPFAPPGSGPSEFSPYGRDGVLAIDIGTLVAKRVPGGIIVRDVRHTDAQGVFTAIPNADDFHRLVTSDGTLTPYFRAGDNLYMFKFRDRTGTVTLLPTPVQISGADALTFIPGLTSDLRFIAKDKNRVYVDGVPAPTIDVKTLTAIPGHPSLFEDAFHLYEFGGGSSLRYTITPFEPPITFFSSHTQSGSEFNDYLKDKNGAYFHKEKIPNADLNTFTVFTSPKLYGTGEDDPIYSYAKDKNAVYYEGSVVQHADPNTFVPVANGGGHYYYGRDASAVYEGTTTIPNIDPETISVLWYPIYEGCGPAQYLKDATHVFFQRTLVPNADPKTFKSLIGSYGRDKNGIWEGVRFRPDLPKDFQPVCNYG